MSTGRLLLATAGLGAASYVGYRWLRWREQYVIANDRREQAILREIAEGDVELLPATLDYWTEMQTPAGAPGPHTTPGGGLTRQFDLLFGAVAAGSIPIPYLRALANGESGLDPNSPKGLINVVAIALQDYNRRHGTNIRADQMRTPMTNVRVAVDTLRRIIESYRKNHPDIPNLREDWSNRAFVELLTLGWNAGYSEAGGVGKVVRYLKGRGQKDITAADIHKHAQAAGASHWLWQKPIGPAKLAWSQGVVRRYFAEKERDEGAARRAEAVAATSSRAPTTAAS